MAFWSKKPHTKAEHIAANRERDIRVRAHQLHMRNAEMQDNIAEQSTAGVESPNAQEGLDQDAASQLGREVQRSREFVHARSRQLKSMRSRIRKGRKKASARGRALGF